MRSLNHTPTAVANIATGWRPWAGLFVLVLAVTLLGLDATVLVLAIPTLSADLGATATEVLWIGDIYSLVLAGLLITIGNVADRYGRRRVLLLGATLFGLTSLLAAFAPTPAILILARALLGLAGATIMPSTLSIVRATFPNPTQRTKAIGIWSAGAAGGAALGPLVGGLLLENFWWGAVFLINIPVMTVLVICGLLVIPESRSPHPRPLDWLSVVTSFTCLVGLVYLVKYLAHAATEIGTSSSLLTLSLPALASLTVTISAGAIFFSRQRNLPQPLVDLRLFSKRAFRGAVLSEFTAVLALSGVLFFFSQYLQLVTGAGPLEAGLRELPLTLAALAIPFFTGIILRACGAGPGIALSLLGAGAGAGLIAAGEGSDSYAMIAAGLIAIGLGTGLAYALTTDVVMQIMPVERAGAASGIVETSYELGIALGIALFGSLQVVGYRAFLDLPAALPAAAVTAAEESLVGASKVLSGEALAQAQHAFVWAMQYNLALSATLLACAAWVAWRALPGRQK